MDKVAKNLMLTYKIYIKRKTVSRKYVSYQLGIQQLTFSKSPFTCSNRGADDHYELLKAHGSAENWGAMVQQIIYAICKNERFGSEYRIAMIYLYKQYWYELIGLLRRNPSFNFLDEFEAYAKPVWRQH